MIKEGRSDVDTPFLFHPSERRQFLGQTELAGIKEQ